MRTDLADRETERYYRHLAWESVERLNGRVGDTDTTGLLRQFWNAWAASRRSLPVWRQANPGQSESLDKVVSSIRLELVSWKSGGASLSPQRTRVTTSGAPLAAHLFLEALDNPFEPDLKKCDCGTYFLGRRNRFRCQKSCGMSRRKQMAKLRGTERRGQIRRARKAVIAYRQGRQPGNWKEWVASRVGDVTAKWVTRAVNRGDLRPPGAPAK